MMNIEEKIRKLALELIHYDFKNAKRYEYCKNRAFWPLNFFWWPLGFLVVMNVFSLIVAKCFADLLSNIIVFVIFAGLLGWDVYDNISVKESHKEAENIKAVHDQYVARLNSLVDKNSDLEITRWWNYINIGDLTFNDTESSFTNLSCAPLRRTFQNEDGETFLANYKTFDDDFISGEKAIEICENPEYRLMVYNGVFSDKTYKLAELVMCQQSAKIEEETRTKSKKRIRRRIEGICGFTRSKRTKPKLF